jgi:hypothetical protein
MSSITTDMDLAAPGRAGAPPNVRAIRGELRVLAVAAVTMIIFCALQLLAILRLTGTQGIAPLLLTSYRVLDVMVVLTFLIYCRPLLRMRFEDVLLIVFATYPMLIGLGRGQLTFTYFNDIAIYWLFLAKIVILRTVLRRVDDVAGIDAAFARHARRIVFFSGLFAVLALIAAITLLRSGVQFLYQAPAEIIFASGYMLAQGHVLAYTGFVIMALLAGKRMVMVGVIGMGLLASLANARIRRATLKILPVALVLVPVVFVLLPMIAGIESPILNRLILTFERVQSAYASSGDFLEFLMRIDPARFAEYVSLRPHLTGWQLAFGNGFGFRYELDAAFWSYIGYEDKGDITNAHFTPLAIVAKFGLLGLALWLMVLWRAFFAPINKASFLQQAGRLALFGAVLESLFAFGFFISVFVPFYIALTTMGRARPHVPEQRRRGMLSRLMPGSRAVRRA